MGSLLNDPAVVDHHDPVRAGDRGQAVGDDEGGSALEQPCQRALNQVPRFKKMVCYLAMRAYEERPPMSTIIEHRDKR